MQEKIFKEIVSCHRSKGYIEESDAITIINDSLVKFNKYTLKLSRIKSSAVQIGLHNAQLLKYIKSNTSIYKEIREYNQLFRFFSKMNITSGYIKKTETPDFELYKMGKSYGIEVTKIYAGNDWVAEKIHNDITAYRLTEDRFKDYMSSSKYSGRVKTYFKNNKINVKALKENDFKEEEIIQIKNKIFEKIRKQLDDYQKFDVNYIFAEIVYTGYKEAHSFEQLNNEIQYFVSHLDANFGNIDFHLILKNGNRFIDFDIKEGTFKDI